MKAQTSPRLAHGGRVTSPVATERAPSLANSTPTQLQVGLSSRVLGLCVRMDLIHLRLCRCAEVLSWDLASRALHLAPCTLVVPVTAFSCVIFPNPDRAFATSETSAARLL